MSYLVHACLALSWQCLTYPARRRPEPCRSNLTWWAELLNATGKHVLIENCHQGRTTPDGVVGPNQETPRPGNNQSNGPCTGLGGTVSNCPYNTFRTSHDIRNTWPQLLENLNSTRPYLGDPPLSRPGAWAYPDML